MPTTDRERREAAPEMEVGADVRDVTHSGASARVTP
jgi:hypothetical protein